MIYLLKMVMFMAMLNNQRLYDIFLHGYGNVHQL
jgi:hypothetical protein